MPWNDAPEYGGPEPKPLTMVMGIAVLLIIGGLAMWARQYY